MVIELMNEWLHQCSDDGIPNVNVLNDNTLIDAIFTVLEDRKYHDEFIDKVCNQLFAYYRINDEFRRFCLMFIPPLIGIHMITYLKPSDRKRYHCVEVLLLSIYNLSVITDDRKPICRVFRLPSLARPSIYHEQSTLVSQQQQSMLTEHALSKLENGTVNDITIPLFGPYREIEQIVANNRMDVITVLLKIYNENISSVPKQSLNALCRMCFKVLRHGTSNVRSFSAKGTSPITNTEITPRNSSPIPLSSTFLIEMVNSIYFCMFNDISDAGLQALDEVHNRAVNHLHSNVLLMTNAIRNSLRVNPSGQPSDGPMGISIALSPTSNNTSIEGIAKTAITNASFKTRKLPDDIPIVTTTGTTVNPTLNTQLSSINEEVEDNDKPKEKSSTIKGVAAGIGKMNVMHLIKDRKEKKKDGIKEQKSKIRTENGDVCSNSKPMMSEDDFGSDTSGISDGKLSYTEETIPLRAINSSKTYPDVEDDDNVNDRDDDDDDNVSNESDSSDAVSVPLVNNTESVQNSIIKHNETSVNV